MFWIPFFFRQFPELFASNAVPCTSFRSSLSSLFLGCAQSQDFYFFPCFPLFPVSGGQYPQRFRKGVGGRLATSRAQNTAKKGPRNRVRPPTPFRTSDVTWNSGFFFFCFFRLIRFSGVQICNSGFFRFFRLISGGPNLEFRGLGSGHVWCGHVWCAPKYPH